jgi:cyclic-di-GMP phosphodiesterase TipF (flagellum assembly factor)
MDGEELLEAIGTALREESVELYLQPVVSLPQRKRRFYECFSRIVTPGGVVITPEQYIPVAESAGLVAAIDNILLVRCVQLVRRARRDHLDVGFFCNISNASLTDVDFLQDFIGFMAENGQLAESLIFEFDHASIAAEDYMTRVNLQRLRQAGYRFSLDQVTDLDLDLEDLADMGFRYIKVNAHLLHEMARGDDPILDMRSLKGALDRNAMDLIVEKIESEDMLIDLLELKVDFGQGYLFGEPRPLVDKQ